MVYGLSHTPQRMYQRVWPEADLVVPDGATTKLWLFAVLSYGIGDLVTTIVGLSTGHLVEASPFVIPLVKRFGLFGMVGLKAGVFGLTGMLWWFTPYPDSLGVPLGLSVVGVLITSWNLYLIITFAV